jgi:hypothetical protein
LRCSTAILALHLVPIVHRLDQLASSCLKAVRHDLANSLREIVREGEVLVVMLAENVTVEKDGRGWFDRAGIEMPAVRREQPRPA